ncbi:CoA-binding protein [Oxalobacteraceae bacterium R-40]|uniref:CoA-binding protein n=1 Tax=Keguizhuia sedimenti TaxID=3064264 RepID=A0ABU1BN04_9BURK|nr:CoA-binding protein [Oxalobacteraceae bacterium R-40]
MSSIPELLSRYRTIAVVGLSASPERPSHGVAKYLQAHGYRIVPVNPSYTGTLILGEPCFPTLAEASEALQASGEKIEIVDCFRKATEVAPIVRDAIAIGAKCVWMQLGVVNEQAAAAARNAGLEVVMDRCIKIEHQATPQRPEK